MNHFMLGPHWPPISAPTVHSCGLPYATDAPSSSANKSTWLHSARSAKTTDHVSCTCTKFIPRLRGKDHKNVSRPGKRFERQAQTHETHVQQRFPLVFSNDVRPAAQDKHAPSSQTARPSDVHSVLARALHFRPLHPLATHPLPPPQPQPPGLSCVQMRGGRVGRPPATSPSAT